MNFYDRASRSLKEIDLGLVLAGHGEEAHGEGGHDDAHDVHRFEEYTWKVFYAFFVVHILTVILNVSAYLLKQRKM